MTEAAHRTPSAIFFLNTMPSAKLPKADAALIQIVDAALVHGAARCGDWLVCKPGCSQCCTGVFAINQVDAWRLQQGLKSLQSCDPARAEAIRNRAQNSVERLSPIFPGNAKTGRLDPQVFDGGTEAEAVFESLGNDEVCPVLDPETGRCELYDYRPMTCRTFGPPVRSEEGLGVCELCFQGATDKQIAACEIHPDSDGREAAVIKLAEKETGKSGETIIAYALL